jgi:hypothetical protein
MESTEVYWKPIFNLLEGSFEVLLDNATHIKAVPGKNTKGLLELDAAIGIGRGIIIIHKKAFPSLRR